MNGRILSYTSTGSPDAPLMVALHGVTDNAASLTDLAEHWFTRYRVVTIDATGHGSSPRFPDLHSCDPMQVMIADTVATIHYIAKDRPVTLMGHSMGGAISSVIAAQHPELIDRLILEEPAWLEPHQIAHYRAQGATLAEHLRWCRAHPLEAFTDQQRDYPTWPLNDALSWLQAKTQTDLRFIETGIVAPQVSWREVAKELTVPTLIITSDGDDVLLGENRIADINALGNPNIHCELLPGCRHCVRREKPKEFYALIDTFLSATLHE